MIWTILSLWLVANVIFAWALLRRPSRQSLPEKRRSF